ncbi:LLM class flavin-dependent oxidoreductase [Saccharopolyspora sp. NPDC002686]|uniref:LLM class flavin-dependent oxidoreductase n=1 Tax=Saccharopolyspora sp. NPDC002686 TaxID=3154541 RepID=UPI003321E7AF
MDIGIFLPRTGLPEVEIREAAYHAVDVELDSLWCGDHLASGSPVLDGMLALATAAAVTECIDIGFAVYLPALRPHVCAAKQIATLQHLTGGDRLHLGIGVGDRSSGWDAVGVDLDARGARTDEFLQLLPSLLAGSPTSLPDGPTVELAPPAPVPPLWIGGASPAALRRAARYGDGWFAALHTPDEIRAKSAQLRELADQHSRPAPRLASVIHCALTKRPDPTLADQLAGSLAETHGVPAETARRCAATGTPAQVAEQLSAYAEAGVEKLAVAVTGDWHASCDLLGETRRLLTAGSPKCRP